jgi:N-glycosylase/DNA lyase
LIAKDFNLKYTIESGQPLAFYNEYSKINNIERLTYPTEKGIIKINVRKAKQGLSISSSFIGDYTDKSSKKEVIKRFGLSDNMKKVYENIDSDAFMHSAISKYYGLRLTENDPWETTLSFVVSQFNNIKRIRLIMQRLINRFGQEIEYDGNTVKLFPTSDDIGSASINSIKDCNAGFRALYIKRIAEEWGSFNYKKLYKMDYTEAKESLMEFKGVGEKVADCILLMGYKKIEAFPVDVWIQKIMEKQYFKRTAKPKEIREFAKSQWKEYAGYAQQYIFWYGRMNKMGLHEN